MKFKSYRDFVNEDTFNSLYNKKNKWIEMIDKGERKQVADNLWVLVQNSYAKLGGHPSIPNVDSIFKGDTYYWEGIDNDKDPEADGVLFGKKRNGIKISGMGHDGERYSKDQLIQKLSAQLKKKGYWIEASDAVEKIMYKNGVKYSDQSTVEKVFKQTVEWQNNKGQYKREVTPGKYHIETLFGNPKI